MQKSSSYRFGLAALLALLVVTAWSLQTMHGFLLHTDHHDQPACSVEHDQARAHIHDTRYATDHCSFCALALSTPVLSPLTARLLPPAVKPVARMILPYQPPYIQLVSGTVCSRGPPAL